MTKNTPSQDRQITSQLIIQALERYEDMLGRCISKDQKESLRRKFAMDMVIMLEDKLEEMVMYDCEF